MVCESDFTPKNMESEPGMGNIYHLNTLLISTSSSIFLLDELYLSLRLPWLSDVLCCYMLTCVLGAGGNCVWFN